MTFWTSINKTWEHLNDLFNQASKAILVSFFGLLTILTLLEKLNLLNIYLGKELGQSDKLSDETKTFMTKYSNVVYVILGMGIIFGVLSVINRFYCKMSYTKMYLCVGLFFVFISYCLVFAIEPLVELILGGFVCKENSMYML